MKQIDPVAPIKDALLQVKSGAESLLILNDVAYLYELDANYIFNLTDKDVPLQTTGVDWRLEYLSTKDK